MAARPTKGTTIFVGDPENDQVIAICATSIDGVASPKEQTDVTTLCDFDRKFIPGMGTPAAMTFGIQFDPQEAAHMRLVELFNNNATDLPVAVGFGPQSGQSPWGDGIGPAPTLSSAGFDLPTNRDFITFAGYIADLPINFAINAPVASTVSIQLSGGYTVEPATT